MSSVIHLNKEITWKSETGSVVKMTIHDDYSISGKFTYSGTDQSTPIHGSICSIESNSDCPISFSAAWHTHDASVTSYTGLIHKSESPVTMFVVFLYTVPQTPGNDYKATTVGTDKFTLIP